jgi:hypothetical protein
MFAASKTDSASTGGYQISRSLRFNSADSAYLNRTPATTTNRRTFTFSAWVKFSKTSDDPFLMGAGSGGQIWVVGDKIRVRLNGSPDYYYDTSAVFRDYSAWYHIVVGVDTTNATPADIVKIYVNSTRQAIGASAAPPQNFDTEFNLASTGNNLGKWPSGSQYLNGYMTEVNFIDGQALTPSSFGETNAQTGVWQPKAYSGSYGTNGFYLNFSDNSNTTAATLGKDYSGNGNNWTPNNFSVTAGAGNDSLVDSPTSYGTDTGVGGTVRGNYSTLNPLNAFGTSTFTNGNLDVSVSSLNTNNLATIAIPTSGKWYWEYQITAIGGGGSPMGGIASSSSNSPAIFYRSNGDKLVDGASSSYGATYTTTDIIGVAVDTDGGTITFYKNGSSQGAVTYATSSGNFFPALRSNAATDNFTLNFGQRAFANTAPSGFKALNTQNLPTPTIGATTATQAGKFFNPVLYTGTGSSLGVTGVGFQPDWVWVKGRSGATDHGLYDAVRGVQKQLESNGTGAETTETTGITAFGSDGFTTGALAQLNTSSATYVAWNWKANGSGSSNTAGSITSTVSANTTSGFSVVTYTGTGANATVGHGLGVAPAMVIVKSRTLAGGHWTVYHSALGNTKGMLMNTSDSVYTNSGFWNNTNPTSTVFTVGTDGSVNQNTQNQVAYCFAEVAGYSKFGSFAANGSTDGPFVFCGFKPAFIIFKSTSAGTNWQMYDSKRNTYNVANRILYPHDSASEATASVGMIDFTSNGFKVRNAYGDMNSSGTTIFMAFAESPFKYSLAR